jgi:16S rRNA (cytidine1402-2'-O)-methyltransferase
MLGHARRGVKARRTLIAPLLGKRSSCRTIVCGKRIENVAAERRENGRIFVVATPLGNLADVSARALSTLREVPLIACEDTRRTGILLRSFGIATRMTSFHEHNERAKIAGLLAHLSRGKDLALVCDAGTPGISDPGFRLVRQARAAGFEVLPIPGPNAAITALSVSGLPTNRFLFIGFLPVKPVARRRLLREIAGYRETIVMHESPRRILASLKEMVEILGDRPAFLCREATKLHEEYVSASLSELCRMLEGRSSIKGEIVLAFGGASESPMNATETPEELYARFSQQGYSRREAVKEAAHRLGLRSRDVYRRMLSRKE